MRQGFVRLSVSVAIVFMATALAYGQSAVTSVLTGTVLDSSGGAIPGATVVAKNNGTGVSTEAVSSSQGTYTIPALVPGTYTVTVSLTGFKTAVYNNVVLNAGVPAAVNAKLEIGGVSETIVVEAAAALVQTVSSAVSSTISTRQIQNLPLTSRSVIDFVTFLPGVATAGGNRQSRINGLPVGAINITLDGINIQDNTLRSTDGFFTIVQPRLDAIEEMTVSTAAGDVAGGASGGVQIRFTTRSGSNDLTGSLYHYYRNDTWKVLGQTLHLNMNTWFNNRNGVAKPKLLQHQTGGRLGGPIVIPGLYDGRGKAFFFTNIENFYQPSQVTRNRTILHEGARAGNFRYLGGPANGVNVLALAAANGHTSTMDPRIAQLLADIRQATTTTGSIVTNANPLHDTYTYNVDAKANNWFPTYRIDYNFTNNHRFSTILNWHTFSSVPDTLNTAEPFFPGFPVMGSQTSKRISSSNTLRSTFGNVVNEARIGYQGSPVEFFNEQFDPGIWNQSFGGQGGFHLTLGSGLTNAGPAPNAQSRNVRVYRAEDTVSWQRGSHSLSAGASFERFDSWNRFRTSVPTVSFSGMLAADPANAMFTTANFPGASGTQLDAAKAFYSLMTGRAISLTGVARVDAATNKYVFSGGSLEESRLDEYGVFIQDSWRARSNLSINVGVRWDVQRPFRALNDSYSTATIDNVWGRSGYVQGCDLSNATPQTCNLFKPGNMPGSPTVYQQFKAGTAAYNTDWNNVAPSIGFNWTPEQRDGLLGTIMGATGDFAIRGGFNRSFTKPAMTDLRARFSGNPGLAITVTRSQNAGGLPTTLPWLFRDAATLTPGTFPESPVFPTSGTISDNVNAIDPNIQLERSDTWSFGVQRGLTKTMAVEVRYVGTRSRNQWTVYNYNEVNIIENGVLAEFKLAQQNLQANVAAGQAAQGFRYRGPGTGTVPLPIFLAYFSGSTDSSNPARYSSTLFTNTTFTNPLARFNPNPHDFANALDADATRRANALAAGLPANFLIANPDKNQANVTGYGGFQDFNSLQVELRRRLANGIQFNASYVWGVGMQSARYSFRVPRETVKSAGISGGEVTHAFKLNWMMELPFGRGKRFGANAGGVLDRIIGGWELHGNARFQSGAWVDFGNVRMVGFDEGDLRKMFKLRIDENQRVFMLPQDVINETVKAFSTSPTSTTGYGAQGAPSGRYFAPAMGPDCLEEIAAGYGQCGTRTLAVRGPAFKEVDISILKRISLINRVQAEFRVEMLNAFNWANFVPVASTSTNPANHEISATTGTNQARVVQLVSRITW